MPSENTYFEISDLNAIGTGTSSEYTFVGGPAAFIFNATFGTNSQLDLEVSVDDGTTFTQVNDIAANDVSKTATGATTEYYNLTLPHNCILRVNVSTAAITSGKAWVSSAISSNYPG